MKHLDTRITALLQQCSCWFAYAVVAIGLLVLMGWQTNTDVLKRIVPGIVAMNPLTALLFIFGGVSFVLFSAKKASYQMTARILTIFIILTAAIKLFEYVIGYTDGIDTVLFNQKLIADRQGAISNRMAGNTALCFIFFGLSLNFSKSSEKRVFVYNEILALFVFFIASLSMIGYIYVVDVFYSILAYIPMALHTAFCFMLLSLAVLFSNPHRGFMYEICSMHAGGIVARRVLPAFFVLPILIGGILYLGEKKMLYGSDFAAAIYTLLTIVIFSIITWRTIRRLNHTDKEKKAVEESLREASDSLQILVDRLRETNQELESFSYSVSHDLRAPLRAINGYAQMLKTDHEEHLDDSGNRMIGIITKNATKMGQLIDDLLNFSRIGRSDLQKEAIDMSKIAHSVVNELCFVEKPKAEIIIEDLPPTVGDPLLLNQLYQNLISNALKYSAKKEHPVIRIGSMPHSAGTTYFVQDNGSGFDMRYYNKLFGVFQRLHKTSDFEGTGVGLAIAQKIISRHKGAIWAESKKDEGAVFYFIVTKKPTYSQEFFQPENMSALPSIK